MKVILSKCWNYIQQSPRGSISHCSVTGKINWDLLIRRERPPPHPLSGSQRKGLRVISFPSNTSPPSEPSATPPLRPEHKCQMPPSSLSRCETQGDKIPDMLRRFSVVCCRSNTREASIQMLFCMSPVFLCIVAVAKPEMTQSEEGFMGFTSHRL